MYGHVPASLIYNYKQTHFLKLDFSLSIQPQSLAAAAERPSLFVAFQIWQLCSPAFVSFSPYQPCNYLFLLFTLFSLISFPVGLLPSFLASLSALFL